MNPILAGLVGASAGAWALTKGRQRLALSRAKHPSLGGHVRMAKRVAGQMPAFTQSADAWFQADGAPADVALRRQAGFERLDALFAARTTGRAGAAGTVSAERSPLATSAVTVPTRPCRSSA